MNEPVEPAGTDAEPVRRLVDYYERAARRMQGMPVCNPNLVVEGVGIREFDGRRIGVIVTPWFMNLTVLPSPADLATWREGAVAQIAFPSGVYDFVVSEAGDNGLIATCSLFSLMHEFADQDSARAAARAAIDALFEPAAPQRPSSAKAATVLSRRKFLGG
ncbi:MAG: [NiFe]-hydrogenase assembly, chaperone, HybE [Steroidobacteraceae bacterium]|nr:[NiFe]-hydrogenase assembly, chaperone, HybE [Steroidobacteraceae bacterium]